MKKALIVFAAAALALAGCKGGGAKTDVAASDSVATAGSGQIAYINLDSLTNNYDMYRDLKGAYEQKVTRLQNDLAARGRSLDKEIADFQDKVEKGLVTRATAGQMQDDLGKKQQNLMQYRDKVTGDLAEEEQVLLNRIHFSIVDFLKEYNAGFRYSMILSTTAGGPILNADPALDITKDVVKGLNRIYAENKAKDPKGEKK